MYTVHLMNNRKGLTEKVGEIELSFHALRLAHTLWLAYGKEREVQITNILDELVWTSDDIPETPALIDAVRKAGA